MYSMGEEGDLIKNSFFSNNEGFGGFEEGGYDCHAIHPAITNWTRMSRFELPKKPKLKWKQVYKDLNIGKYDVNPTFTIDSDIRVLVAESDPNDIISVKGRLICLYPDGTVKWTYVIDYNAYDNVALDKDGNLYVYIEGAGKGKLMSISENGFLNWEHNLPSANWSDPVISQDGTIYFGLIGTEALYAFSKSGEILWEKTIGREHQDFMNIAKDGTIYVELAGVLYALFPNGEVKWSYKPNNNIWKRFKAELEAQWEIHIIG